MPTSLPGAQLSPVDLPPPPPAADPREPPQIPNSSRRSGARTPQRSRSPLRSREGSPTRPTSQLSYSNSLDASSPPPLQYPSPRSAIGSAAGPSASVAIHPLGHSHHLSRPSSPSSIHSSGSAIFERDIELPPVASLSLNPIPAHSTQTLNHKASRLSHLSHGSALDHTVPAVLDDAVEALTGDGASRGIEGLEIEAPAPAAAIGMARTSSVSLPGTTGRKASAGPAGVLGSSRSPSPISIASRASASPAQSPPILGQLSAQQQGQSTTLLGQSPPGSSNALSTSPGANLRLTGLGSVPRPALPQRVSTGPQLPGGWGFGTSTPTPAKTEGDVPSPEEELPPPAKAPSPVQTPTPPSAVPSHLTPTKEKRRISYLSYNDLLLSVPTTVTSLGEITSGNLSPDHLPGTVSPSIGSLSPVVPPPNGPGSVSGVPSRTLDSKTSWDAGSSGRLGGLGLGNGEWGREGLGKGLEQRLEDLAHNQG